MDELEKQLAYQIRLTEAYKLVVREKSNLATELFELLEKVNAGEDVMDLVKAVCSQYTVYEADGQKIMVKEYINGFR